LIAAALHLGAAVVEIYRGELLDGIALDEEPFERWVAERRQVRGLASQALETSRAEVKDQRVRQAIETALRLLAFDSTQEAVSGHS
jgi:hypothetical protein